MPLLQECSQRSAVKRKIRIVEAASPARSFPQRLSETASPTSSIPQEQRPSAASLRNKYFGNVTPVTYARPSVPHDARVIYPAHEFEMPTFEEMEIMGPMMITDDPEESRTMLDGPPVSPDGVSKKTTDHPADDLDFIDTTALIERSTMPCTLNRPAAGTSSVEMTTNDFLTSSACDGSDGRSEALSISSDSDSQNNTFHADDSISSFDGFEINDSTRATRYYLEARLLDFREFSGVALDKHKSDLSAAESAIVETAPSAKRSLPASDGESFRQMEETSFPEMLNPVDSVENSEKGGPDLRNASVSTNGGTAEDENASVDSAGSHGTIRTIPRNEERVYEKGALVYINANASRKDTLPYWYPGEIVDVGYSVSHWQDKYTEITAVSYTIDYVYPKTVDNVRRKFYTGQNSKECLIAESFTPDSPEMRKKVALDNAAFLAPASKPKKSRRQSNNNSGQRRRSQAPRARATSVINPSVLKIQKEGTRSSGRIRGKSVAPEPTKKQLQPESRRIDHSAIITRLRRQKIPKQQPWCFCGDAFLCRN